MKATSSHWLISVDFLAHWNWLILGEWWDSSYTRLLPLSCFKRIKNGNVFSPSVGYCWFQRAIYNWFNFQLGTLHQVTMGMRGSGSTSMMRCITGCCAPCTASCRDARYAHGSAAIGRRAGRLNATQRRLGLQSKKILPWMRHDISYYRIFTIYYYIDLYITMHNMIL